MGREERTATRIRGIDPDKFITDLANYVVAVGEP